MLGKKKALLLFFVIFSIISLHLYFFYSDSYQSMIKFTRHNTELKRGGSKVILFLQSSPAPDITYTINLTEYLECSYKYCVITYNISYLSKITDYDVIVFYRGIIAVTNIPLERSPHQLYIMASIE